MSIFMEIINLFCWTNLKNFESSLKEFSKKFKKFLTADEKGSKIGNIKKESRKRNE